MGRPLRKPTRPIRAASSSSSAGAPSSSRASSGCSTIGARVPSKSRNRALSAGRSRSGASSAATSGARAMGSDANTAGTLAGHRTLALVGIGLLAGFFSALFGVGGGIVIVPLLISLVAMDAKVATATSLATIIFTSFVGVVSHAALGNVEWGYALLVGIPAVAGLLGGLWVKDRVSSRQLTLAFAALLVAVGIWLIVKPGERSTVPSLGAAEAIDLVAIGIVAGCLAGLFGVGGGILFVPALALVVGLPQVHAEATSLLAIIPVALIGS